MESEMAKDSVLSQKLSDIAEKKQGFRARQVEASDRERVEAESASSGSGNITGPHPGNTVETLIDVSDSSMYTWIECSSDKRTWAEVLEEEGCVTAPTITEGSAPPKSGGGKVHTITGCSFADPMGPDKCPRPEKRKAREGDTFRNQSKFDVCEVFSPPRICPFANTHTD